MKSRHFRRLIACFVSVAAMAAGPLTTINSAEAATAVTTADAALRSIPGLTSSSIGVQTRIDERLALISSSSDTTVTAPKSATEGVRISSSGKMPVKVGIPGAKNAGQARKTDEGIVLYPDTAPSASTAVQAASDGSTRFLTIINGSNAPLEYRFPFTLPEGRLSMAIGGSIAILDSSGDSVGIIQPPWAFDAKRKVIPTTYTLDGNTVVLRVEHKGATYPVVADPNVSTNCGSVTCTLYFSRSTTKEIAIKAQLVGIGAAVAAAICAVVTGGTALAICGFVTGAIFAVIGWFQYAASTDQCAIIKYGVTTLGNPVPGVSNSSYCPDGNPAAVSVMTRFNNKCLDADLNTINNNGTIVQLWIATVKNNRSGCFIAMGLFEAHTTGAVLMPT